MTPLQNGQKVGANGWTSKHERIPQLRLVGKGDDSNYAWLPLSTRADIDRVRRVVDDSGWFDDVSPVGSHNKKVKKKTMGAHGALQGPRSYPL